MAAKKTAKKQKPLITNRNQRKQLEAIGYAMDPSTKKHSAKKKAKKR